MENYCLYHLAHKYIQKLHLYWILISQKGSFFTRYRYVYEHFNFSIQNVIEIPT